MEIKIPEGFEIVDTNTSFDKENNILNVKVLLSKSVEKIEVEMGFNESSIIEKQRIVKYYTENNISVREIKESFSTKDIECTNCKNLFMVEATSGICKIKDIQVSNSNYCDLFDNKFEFQNQ